MVVARTVVETWNRVASEPVLTGQRQAPQVMVAAWAGTAGTATATKPVSERRR